MAAQRAYRLFTYLRYDIDESTPERESTKMNSRGVVTGIDRVEREGEFFPFFKTVSWIYRRALDLYLSIGVDLEESLSIVCH